jgi:putative membrane protein
MKNATIAMIIGMMSFCDLEAQTISENDRQFINEAAQANMLEMKLGELAQTHTTTDKVMVLGRHMIEDHGRSEGELKTLASKKSVVLPTNLDAEGYKVYDKLVKKQGKDFDKAFTKYMVKDHKKDIDRFKKQAEKGDDAELKTWAQNTIPKLEHHKKMSEEACKAVKEMK